MTTPVNVWASCVACAVVEHLSCKQLEPISDTSVADNTCSDVTADTDSVAIDILDNVQTADDISKTNTQCSEFTGNITCTVALDIVKEREDSIKPDELVQNVTT